MASETLMETHTLFPKAPGDADVRQAWEPLFRTAALTCTYT